MPLMLLASENHPHYVFIYIAILNMGMLAITLYKPWSGLVLGSYIGTIVVVASWFSLHYTHAQFDIYFLYSTLFFITFLAASLMEQSKHQSATKEAGTVLAIATPTIYFLATIFLIHTLYPQFETPFTVLLGVLYGALGAVYYRQHTEPTAEHFSRMLLLIAFCFFIVAAPIEFDHHGITIAWALLALGAVLLGAILRQRVMRGAGVVLLTVAFLKFIAFDLSFEPSWHAFINDRFIAALFLAFCMALSAYLAHRTSEATSDDRSHVAFLSVGTYLTLVMAISLEIRDFYSFWWLGIIWSLAALLAGTLSFSLRSKWLRIVSYMTFGAAAIRIVGYDGLLAKLDYTPIFNSRVGLTLLLVLCLTMMLMVLRRADDRVSDEEKKLAKGGLFLGINLLLLWMVSSEVIDYFVTTSVQRVMLSVCWTIYAIILLMFGIVTKSSFARTLSLILFGIVVLKVFLYDAALLGDLYRFISFFTLGIILLVSGFLYHKYKDRIRQFIQAQ